MVFNDRLCGVTKADRDITVNVIVFSVVRTGLIS
jgi:hypothetical protein